MATGNFDRHFPTPHIARRIAPMTFITHNLNRHVDIIRRSHRCQLSARTLNSFISKNTRFLSRLGSHIKANHAGAPPICPGNRGLIFRWHLCPPRAPSQHAIGIDLLESHVGEITNHVWESVITGITNLIKELFTYASSGDTAPSATGLGDNNGAIGRDFSDGIAHFMQAIRDLFPVGVVTSGHLRSTLDQVPCEGTRCQ